MTPPVTEADVPIVEDSFSQESMPPETETTLPSISFQVTTPVVAATKPEVFTIDPFGRPIPFSSLTMLTEGNFP